MKKTVTDYVIAFLVCQQHKFLASSPQGLLQLLTIPKIIWEEVSMDFVVKFPKYQGFDTTMVVMDRLSKYGPFIPIKHPYTENTIVDIFVKDVIRLHGILMSIVEIICSVSSSSFNLPNSNSCSLSLPKA